MELKQTPADTDTTPPVQPFNRTSMELKLAALVEVLKHSWLLIEPVWNWNKDEGIDAFIADIAFNRTSMELKLCITRVADTLNGLLIEPVWNWNDLEADALKTEVDF